MISINDPAMNQNHDPSLRCELCETEMTVQRAEGSAVAYFHCAGCNRWVASPYGEDILRTGTARVDHAGTQARKRAEEFDKIKNRLERWLTALDESDPFHVLGLQPSASEESIRSRFRELALENHPDRGGDPARMRRVLTAYDKIRKGKLMHDDHTVISSSTVAARPYRRR